MKKDSENIDIIENDKKITRQSKSKKNIETNKKEIEKSDKEINIKTKKSTVKDSGSKTSENGTAGRTKNPIEKSSPKKTEKVKESNAEVKPKKSIERKVNKEIENNVENKPKKNIESKAKKEIKNSNENNPKTNNENKEKVAKSRKTVKAENEFEGNKGTNSEKILKNGAEEDNTIQKETEPEKDRKPIENIMDTNRLKIREKIREKIVENQLKRNIVANRTIEIILSLGFILSFVVIFLMWSNGKYLSEDILGAMLNLLETHESNPLLVIGGAILIMGEKLLSLGNYHASLIFITLISIVCILKIFGVYQAFKRDKYKGRGVSSQNAADCVIASILLINAIILSGIEATHISSRVDMFINGITIYDIVLTILLVYGMNIRNNIKRYYKWKIEAKREL